MTEVARMVDGKEVKVSYTYENEKVTSIGHNGFTYDYAYDPFGNLESVSVGGGKLERTTLRRQKRSCGQDYLCDRGSRSK